MSSQDLFYLLKKILLLSISLNTGHVAPSGGTLNATKA